MTKNLLMICLLDALDFYDYVRYHVFLRIASAPIVSAWGTAHKGFGGLACYRPIIGPWYNRDSAIR